MCLGRFGDRQSRRLLKGAEGLYWVPAVPFNGSKTAGGVIWDVGAVDSPACGPELVGAAGVVLVQNRGGDKAGEPWEGAASVPMSSAPLVALACTRDRHGRVPPLPLDRDFWPSLLPCYFEALSHSSSLCS